MKTRQLLTLIFLCSFHFVSGASANQIPVLVEVQIADNDVPLQSFDRSGTLSGATMTASWTVDDFSAEFTISGHGHVDWVSPRFVLVWEDTGSTMPLSVNITSNTTGPYTILPVFTLTDESDPDLSLAQIGITNSTYFGHYFPACKEVFFSIGLDHVSAPYEIAATLEWGLGVPVESASWGRIKSLYR